MNDSSYYILHNCELEKYKKLSVSQYLVLQVYTHDVINKHMAIEIDKETLSYYKNNCLWTTWATDLLPDEINKNIDIIKNDNVHCENILPFIGAFTYKWGYVMKFCESQNIRFIHHGGYKYNNVSVGDNIALIQKSLLAPAIQCDWQCENGYIPCRIFKNISYGKMGITNNEAVYELFNKNVIFDRDIYNVLTKGLEFENKNIEEKLNILIPLMELVRDKHTYINRIEIIFKTFKECK